MCLISEVDIYGGFFPLQVRNELEHLRIGRPSELMFSGDLGSTSTTSTTFMDADANQIK